MSGLSEILSGSFNQRYRNLSVTLRQGSRESLSAMSRACTKISGCCNPCFQGTPGSADGSRRSLNNVSRETESNANDSTRKSRLTGRIPKGEGLHAGRQSDKYVVLMDGVPMSSDSTD